MASLAIGTPAAAQDVAAELRAQTLRFVELINSGDSAGIVGLYLDRPGVATLGDGDITTGWSNVAREFGAFLKLPGLRFEVADSIRVMPLGADAGLAYFGYRIITSQGPLLSGAITIVFLRTARGWRVAHDHTSSSAESAAGAARQPSGTDLLAGGPRRPVRPTQSCLVTRIVDGDTIDCTGIGRVRLIGMDTPELSQEPFGRRASEALAAFLPPGETVEFERDVEPTDRYGRALGYLWRGGALINWLMVRNGWAILLTIPPNVQYVDAFTEAQRLAREERRGLWAVDGFACPPAERRRGRC